MFLLQQHTKDHYFFDSAAKISFFFEVQFYFACIKRFWRRWGIEATKRASINKVGHALHELDPLYKEFTYSSKVSSLVSSFGRHAVHVHFQDGLVRRFVRGENGVTYDQPSPSYEQKDFVPIEMKPGSIIAIHGDLIHQSFENLSPKSRHAYSLHVVESDGCKWAQDNWIRRENTPEPLYSP
ncbi:hypothetical protein IGI04_035090 [Brassica rapa subsp. trilocularis]|uniref:Fe2OG dioxygenase domain-containing protein n=1 Tax=Brassica rapa subsp. trilocularis TaxID=1813537 RepID=A0ABQ7LDD7_BRACM|nr:hypothetical protein IGI04_035090 [Brassica rapa subsp. trilocularis]